MTHKNADELSESIDRWLRRAERMSAGPLHEVVDSLASGFPDVADDLARERVRRRLSEVDLVTRSPQELLLERAFDSAERIGRRLGGDEYVPWPTVAGAAAVLVASVVALAWLRRRGLQES